MKKELLNYVNNLKTHGFSHQLAFNNKWLNCSIVFGQSSNFVIDPKLVLSS